MTFERDPLWAKARLFFGRALGYEREDPQFGLWCALGLELLLRAAVASVSPALLAEPDRDHKYLLQVLGRGDPRLGPKSISAVQATKMCQHLFAGFTADQTTAAIALLNRRNMELHTGASAFEDYTTQQWVPGFYRCCDVLVVELGETLEMLFGAEEAVVAREVLKEAEREVRQRVEKRIASHRNVFQGQSDEEQEALLAKAGLDADTQSSKRGHRVTCPACGADASVGGEAFGPARVSHDEEDGSIAVRQAVIPKSLSCVACRLKLDGYAELVAAKCGDQYTRTSRYSPEEYFELINPDDVDAVQDLVDRHLVDRHLAEHGGYVDYREYDNE